MVFLFPMWQTWFPLWFLWRDHVFHHPELLEGWRYCHIMLGNFNSGTHSLDLHSFWVGSWWKTWQQPRQLFLASISSTSLYFRFGNHCLHFLLLEALLVATAFFSFGVVDYDRVFVQLGLKILLVDWRHLLLILTWIRLWAGSYRGFVFESTVQYLQDILFRFVKVLIVGLWWLYGHRSSPCMVPYFMTYVVSWYICIMVDLTCSSIHLA